MTLPTVDFPILSVSALTHSIKLLLEGQFRYVCVQGEVSNCKLQTSGHLYFSLKDSQAQIAAVMFKPDVAALTRLPKDGDQVVIKGTLNVYPPNGKYQIVARSLELAGLGALLIKLEELKAKLKELGYFALERKKHLPKYPKKIGVVTSPTGAVIQDIVNVLTRRFSGFHLILYPVKVQGDGAAQEIASAIDFFNAHKLVDVMIVGRGGGSIEDLWAFNERVVADAIFRSLIPIISAVGHETDYTIADAVADVRAPTPSAAAEMVIAEKAQQLLHLAKAKRFLEQTLFHLIRHDRNKLQGLLKHPLFSDPYAFLGPKIQRLDEIKGKLDRQIFEKLQHLKHKLAALKLQNEALKPTVKIKHYQEKIAYYQKAIALAAYKKIHQEKVHLIQLQRLLHAIDPRNLLSKGYSIIFSENLKKIITSVHSLSANDSVKILFADGNAKATIKEIPEP